MIANNGRFRGATTRGPDADAGHLTERPQIATIAPVRLKQPSWSAIVILVSVAAAISVFLPLGRMVLNEHEVFAAEPGQELLAGGSWVLQQFAGEYRTKKPPGQSWLIAASLFVTRSESEWAARLPSALAGVGFALTAGAIGSWLAGRRLGLIAGLMAITCIAVQQRSVLAEADMALAFAIALAHAMLLRPMLVPGARRRACALGFWAAVVAGFMLKGPIVLGFTLLPAVVFLLVDRFALRHRESSGLTARTIFWPPAMAAGLLLIIAWPVSAYLAYPGVIDQWRHETLSRIGGELRKDPLLKYAWLIPLVTLPWAIFAVPGAIAFVKHRLYRRSAQLMLLCWGVCGVLMISAISFKAPHYALPMLLPVLLLSAFGFKQVLTSWLRHRAPQSRTRWFYAAVAGWFGTAVVAWSAFHGVIEPKSDPGAAVIKFANEVNAIVGPEQTVYLLKTGEDRTTWYLRSHVRQLKEPWPAERPLYAICDQLMLNRLQAEGVPLDVLARADLYTLKNRPEDHDERRILVRLR